MPAIPVAAVAIAIYIPFILTALNRYPNGFTRQQPLEYKTDALNASRFSCGITTDSSAKDYLPLYAELQTAENGVLTNDVKVFVSGEPRLYFTVNDVDGPELIIGTTDVPEEAAIFEIMREDDEIHQRGRFHLEYTMEEQRFALISRSHQLFTCDHTIVLRELEGDVDAENSTSTSTDHQFKYYNLTGIITPYVYHSKYPQY